MRLTQAAYARHRGVTRGAVNQRTQRAGGPIPTYGARHLIDPKEADRLWFATMSPAGYAQTAHARDASLEADGEPGGTKALELARARADLMIAEAELRRLRLEERRGNLLDRHTTLAKFFAVVRAQRDSWLTFASRIGAELGAELGVEASRVMIVLEKHVRAHLTQLADAQLELGATEGDADADDDDGERSPRARRHGSASAPA